MNSAELRREASKEEAKIQRLKKEQERINNELKDAQQLLAVLERGIKRTEKIEMESAKRMKKAEEEVESNLAALRQQNQTNSADEVPDAGDN